MASFDLIICHKDLHHFFLDGVALLLLVLGHISAGNSENSWYATV
jgi:hypothetical protein